MENRENIKYYPEAEVIAEYYSMIVVKASDSQWYMCVEENFVSCIF